MKFSKPLILSFGFCLLSLVGRPSGGDALSPLQNQFDLASPGSVVKIAAGTYSGNFTITKSLTVIGEDGATLDGRGEGTVLTIHAPDVHVSGLTLQNSGKILGNEDSALKAENSPRLHVDHVRVRNTLFGIEVLASPGSTIENSDVSGWALDLGRRGDGLKIWYSPGARIFFNHIHQSRDMLFWYSDNTVIHGNLIESSRYGIHYMYSHGSIAENNTLRHNSVGIYDMYSNDVTIRDNKIIANRGPSGFAVAVKESDNFRVIGNYLLGNRVGIHVDNSPVTVRPDLEQGAYFKRNRIVRNDIGVAFVGIGQGTLFRWNDVVDNWQQVSTKGAGSSLAHWEENYWSDYRGIDPRGTGFGISPYNTLSLTDELSDLYESFRVFNFGPAMVALQFAEQAVPWLLPDAKAVDPRPAMVPHAPREASSPPAGSRVLFAGLAAVLVLSAANMRKVYLYD